MIPTREDASYNFNDDTVDHLSRTIIGMFAAISLHQASGISIDDNLHVCIIDIISYDIGPICPRISPF